MSAATYTSRAVAPPARTSARIQRVLAALAVCLPVPVCAASGLSLPLPATVERIAAALVPWADAGALSANEALRPGVGGSIVAAGSRPVDEPSAPATVGRLRGVPAKKRLGVVAPRVSAAATRAQALVPGESLLAGLVLPLPSDPRPGRESGAGGGQPQPGAAAEPAPSPASSGDAPAPAPAAAAPPKAQEPPPATTTPAPEPAPPPAKSDPDPVAPVTNVVEEITAPVAPVVEETTKTVEDVVAPATELLPGLGK